MANREMKDSEIEWVGEIPNDWDVKLAKRIFKREKREIFNQEIVTAFRDGEVTQRRKRRSEGFTIATKEIGYQGVKKGDLVIHSMDAFAGAIGVSDSDGKSTPVYLVCSPKIDTDNQYYAYLLRAYSNVGYIESMAKGIRERSTDFRFSTFSITPLIYPSLIEQQKIAAFLDEKVAHIDNIIEDTKKSIENLKAYKQSLITETVTKGLDPNVEMKDSGIEWIGKIPKYWKVEKTKYSYKFNKGLSITKADLIDEGIPVINYGEIHSKYGVKFNPEKHIVKKVNPDYKRYNNALLKYGDVIFADTSEDIEGSGNFTTFLGETNCFAGYHTVVLKPIKRNNYIFMTYLFDSLTYRRQVRNMVQGIKVFSITQSILKNTYVWLPPIKEQNEIAIYLENKIPTLDKMISEKEKIIEELKDYKKSLIYEYVTGKKEVK